MGFVGSIQSLKLNKVAILAVLTSYSCFIFWSYAKIYSLNFEVEIFFN
jgi:hypothetical protein